MRNHKIYRNLDGFVGIHEESQGFSRICGNREDLQGLMGIQVESQDLQGFMLMHEESQDALGFTRIGKNLGIHKIDEDLCRWSRMHEDCRDL